MVDADVLAVKLRELVERVARARAHCPPTPADLAADPDVLDLVAFNLMLAVQACIDIASHCIADEHWPPAATAAESFRRLSEHGVVTAVTAELLGRAAGLRNVVAHGYADVDPQLIHLAATQGAADLERFAAEVGAWAASEGR